MSKPSASIGSALAEILKEADAHRGDVPSEDFKSALNQAVQLGREDRGSLRLQVAESLVQLNSVTGAGFLAVWLGAAAERGADPEPLVEPLWNGLKRFVTHAGSTADEKALGLQFFGQGLVAHVARAPKGKASLLRRSDDLQLLEAREDESVGLTWVLELLRKRSGELLVLHGERAEGVVVEYKNISNCFHLFSLLQIALQGRFPGARQVKDSTIDAVLGRGEGHAHDEAWWHYGQPSSPHPDLSASVWGEASPNSVEVVDGQQVILLWPPLLGGRSWDGNFFQPFIEAAPPSAEVRSTLTDDEVRRWRRRLKLET